MRYGLIALSLVAATNTFAASDFIGTHSKPIPMQPTGDAPAALKNITLYFYQDHSYTITDGSNVLFSGQFSQSDNGISLSNRPAYANKVSVTSNGKPSTCLQTVFYKPSRLAYRPAIFCHR